jgi:HPt (histidine-containing phosphotransfer) domain-containing protein
MAVLDLPDGMDPTLQAQFQKIRHTFVKGLPHRLQSMRMATGHDALKMDLHRLAGAAGGYGFPRIGGLARNAMDAAANGTSIVLESAMHALENEIQTVYAEYGRD